MTSRFGDEEDDGKVKALRRLKPRGLGVWMVRLKRRLADLDMLGSKPKASEWFYRLVMCTDAKWNDIPEIYSLREAERSQSEHLSLSLVLSPSPIRHLDIGEL